MKGLVRGCGRRQKNAAYLEVAMSPWGSEIEIFLIDPPIPIDKDALGLSAIGAKLIKREPEDVWDVWDIIGESFYPNVQDFIEEARRFGISRRLSSKLDFSLLTDKSKLMTMHSRAWIDNHYDYTVLPAGLGQCPKQLRSHDPWNDNATSVMCVGLYSEDIEGGQSVTADCTRLVERTMPAFKYSGYCRPFKFDDKGRKVYTVTPSYRLALFAAFPIGRLVVIRDEDGAHEATLQKAKAAKITVELEDE